MVWRLPPNAAKNPDNKPATTEALNIRETLNLFFCVSVVARKVLNKFNPIENAPVKVRAKMVESIKLYVIDEGIPESFVKTAVTRCPK